MTVFSTGTRVYLLQSTPSEVVKVQILDMVYHLPPNPEPESGKSFVRRTSAGVVLNIKTRRGSKLDPSLQMPTRPWSSVVWLGGKKQRFVACCASGILYFFERM